MQITNTVGALWPVTGPLCDMKPVHKEEQQDTWLHMQAKTLKINRRRKRITEFKDITSMKAL